MGMKKILAILILFSGIPEMSAGNTRSKPPFEKEYRVVVMLPFCLGMNDKWKVRDIMAEYYEGIEIALEELSSMGLKMNLTVLDTKMDSLEVIRLLSDPELQKTDLFIGPVYDNEIVEVLKFCSVYKIPLVLPLRYHPNITGGDFPLINCNAVDSLQYYYTGKHAATAFRNFQCIVIDDLMPGSISGAARNFKKGYEAVAGKNCIIANAQTTDLETFRLGNDSLLLYYTGKGPSSCNHAIVQKEKANCIVAGPAEWLNIDRVNYHVLNKMYFYDTYSVPYNDTVYKSFRLQYRNRYGGDPERYTFIGYDQFMFFGSALMAFGIHFPGYILEKEFNYTHRTFHFVKRGNLIENAGTNLFYYKDYHFFKALWRY